MDYGEISEKFQLLQGFATCFINFDEISIYSVYCAQVQMDPPLKYQLCGHVML